MHKENIHTIPLNQIYDSLGSSEKGLSSTDASSRLASYGPNTLPTKKKTSLLKQFFAQFSDFMIIILIIAAIVSFIASIAEGNADYVDPIIILTIIIFNAIVGLIQERKAEHSLDALKKLSAPYASVIRDGVLKVIPARDLVPGDVIILESGNLVPADARLIEATSLKIDESALTGESVPADKRVDLNDVGLYLNSKNINSKKNICNIPLAERTNMAYSSTIVTTGHGKAIVVSTGTDTEVGQIAHLISEDTSPDTPLQKTLAKTSKYLGIIALAICFIIFLVGVFQGRGIFDMFMTSISLAVASIPEGLPIIVTIVLSMGVSKMAANHAIIRTLPSVETLGSATYVCSDKTGTLTENKMTVTKICNADGISNNNEFILSLACLCNNSVHSLENSNPITVHGEPTENALVHAALNNHIDKNSLEIKYPRIHEIPFDSKRKLMTTVHKLNTSHQTYRTITKGALEMVLKLCTHYYDGTTSLPLTKTVEKSIINTLNAMSDEALRVIAIAYKDGNKSDAYNENNLCFVGLIGMIDPPRKEAYAAVQNCILAGITPVMITGDHPRTAYAIANKLGICTNNSKDSVITGAELDTLSNGELKSKVKNFRVCARVTPAHKVRIVKALQENGEIVAMTGDGVNDAPALKSADIGCAMGVNGTDVAKNASDMILADDNFATIVTAIKEGRGIYENIRKAIHFLLSCNIGEIITILVAIIFNLPTPLLAVQLLWINLVTDSLPAISLGVEPIDKDILYKKHNTNNNFFTKSLTAKIITEGMMIGMLTLISFIIGYRYMPVSSQELALMTGRTMAFATLGLSQLFHAFNMKSDGSILSKHIFNDRKRIFNDPNLIFNPTKLIFNPTKLIFNNPKLIGSFIICVILQVSVISVPALATIFKVVPLGTVHWLIVMVISSLPIPIVELQKRRYT